MGEHPNISEFRPRVRQEIRSRRAQHGDHATCPVCEMTVLVDPRAYPGRLTEHRPVPAADVCRATGWWRCTSCMDGPDVAACTFCHSSGWLPPASGGAVTPTGGLRWLGDAPQRPGDVLDPTEATPAVSRPDGGEHRG